MIAAPWLLVAFAVGMFVGWAVGYITRALLSRADTGTPADGEDET